MKTILAAAIAAFAIATPAQAEPRAACFQREKIQRHIAQLQRSNSVLELRNDWASEVGRLQTELLKAPVGSDTTKLRVQIAIAKDRAESEVRRLQIEVDSADNMAYLAPSSCR